MRKTEKQRLDRFVSNQLNISRSEVKTHIRRGKVSVSGRVERDPSLIIDVSAAVVEYNGAKIEYKKNVYIIMNKPKGVLSASNDKSRETVVDLVPSELRRTTLFPVGRLDKDTTGLLIITDDGEFAHNCIAPKKGISKVYEALLDGPITPEMPDKFMSGVILADGTPCKSAKLQDLGDNRVRITITEGKYHQIKRMFGVFDLGVNELHRVSIGDLVLPEHLKEGECEEISAGNIKKILKTAF